MWRKDFKIIIIRKAAFIKCQITKKQLKHYLTNYVSDQDKNEKRIEQYP